MIEQTQESTAQEIWQLFRETDRKFQETQQELARQSQETDRKFQETDRKFQETRQELARQFAETNRLFQASDIKLEKTRQQVSELTSSWGKFVESMVEPALVVLFRTRDIEISWTAPHVKCRKPGVAMEIDILGVNQEYVVAVEVKTTLKVDDVKDHLQRLARFKEAFPEYHARRVVGAVAGMRLEQEADRYAMRQGLFVLAQSGDAVQLLNDATFTPRVW